MERLNFDPRDLDGLLFVAHGMPSRGDGKPSPFPPGAPLIAASRHGVLGGADRTNALGRSVLHIAHRTSRSRLSNVQAWQAQAADSRSAEAVFAEATRTGRTGVRRAVERLCRG
eukprot:m.494837 g.494837  ORF g.494837 m.494837 type:complete len:114 (-) comp127748_c0_seq1:150-491(-)